MSFSKILRPVSSLRFNQIRNFSVIRKEFIGIPSATKVKNVLNFSRSKKGGIYCVNQNLQILNCAEVLTKANVASLLVVNIESLSGDGMLLTDLKKDDIVGIVGERDIARTKLQSGKVEEIMSTNLITIGNETNVGDAMELMLEKNIRHLPVFEGEKVAGFLSMKDLLHACAYREGEGAQAIKARGERPTAEKFY